MLKLLIIGQGSQTIQLIRQLFSLEVTPHNLKVITIKGDFNTCFIEFISYYNIDNYICNRNTFNKIIQPLITTFFPHIVISFSNPFILSEETLSSKTKFINFHPGVLPFYKGNLSTVHSLINKEQYVGGTWHYIDKGVDTGNIIKIVKTPSNNLNAFTLNHKIFSLGINCLSEIIEKVNQNYLGTIQKQIGKFYSNKFPDVNKLDSELQKKLLYFPPKFL